MLRLSRSSFLVSQRRLCLLRLFVDVGVGTFALGMLTMARGKDAMNSYRQHVFL